MIESRSRRKTWPDFSPCNSNSNSSSSSTNRALHINDQSPSSLTLSNSHSSFKTYASSYSVDLLTEGIRKQQLDSSVGSCPANWKRMNSFLEICPSSQTHGNPPPSPKWSISSSRNINTSTTMNNNSPDIISFSSTTSDIFYSQVSSTQFSTPRNKNPSSPSLSCTQSISHHDQIVEEMMSTTIINNEDFHSFYQHSLQSKEGEADHVKQEYSPNKRWSLSSAGGGFRSSIERCQPLLGMPLMVVGEEQQQIDNDDDDIDDDESWSPMYEHHSRLVSRPKPYQDFLDEIKRKELEAKYNTWKEAKQLKLTNRLRMKEAEIDAWELKQRRKAKIEMKKIEGKLDRKRSKAIEETQKKISNIKKKAEKLKARERQLVASKISMNSRITDKIKATLKCFCC